jgi:hypothetical protein
VAHGALFVWACLCLSIAELRRQEKVRR